MENEQVDKGKAKKEAPKKGVFLKKVDAETARLIHQLRDKANKKTFGRKVRDAEIIGAALRLLTQEHIKELQESSYSERDRLAIAHEDYQRTNGKITLDQFIGKLLKGEISLKSN